MTHKILENDRELPSLHPQDNAVHWSLFRRRKEAEQYLEHMRLDTGYELIGGHSHDSIGDYWWVGLRVPSIADWGHSRAVNKHARHGD
ncbi:hypothetical protein [Acidiferrobacter sp.]|uniref:hypothetical protein n=1 Tax=Acidiferrobacter sp. TaxID=1872107 RepID=UPI002618BEDE|nr:hypothetical protein [Acidiferrobacter sp.]